MTDPRGPILLITAILVALPILALFVFHVTPWVVALGAPLLVGIASGLLQAHLPAHM